MRIVRTNGARFFQLSSKKFVTYNREKTGVVFRTAWTFQESCSCKFFRTFPPFLFFVFPFNGISRMGAIKTPVGT